MKTVFFFLTEERSWDYKKSGTATESITWEAEDGLREMAECSSKPAACHATLKAAPLGAAQLGARTYAWTEGT